MCLITFSGPDVFYPDPPTLVNDLISLFLNSTIGGRSAGIVSVAHTSAWTMRSSGQPSCSIAPKQANTTTNRSIILNFCPRIEAKNLFSFWKYKPGIVRCIAVNLRCSL